MPVRQTREDLAVLINDNFLDNTSGLITPEKLREVALQTVNGAVFPEDIGVEEIDYEDISTMIEESAFLIGQLYRIRGCHKDTSYGKLYNDGTDSGTTIYLRAIAYNALEPIGIGEFYAPKAEVNQWCNLISFDDGKNNPTGSFDINETVTTDTGATLQLLGNYKTNVISYISGDITASTRITGTESGASIQVSTIEFISTYQIGDVVSFGGYVWENLTGERGTANQNSLDNTNWQKVAYSTEFYDILYDAIEYDITTNKIISRRNSKYNNQVSYSVTMFLDSYYSPLAVFDWNNEDVNGNIISNAYVNLVNYQGTLTFSNNICKYSQFNSDLMFNTAITACTLNMATITLSSLITSVFAKSTFENEAALVDVNLYTTNISEFVLSQSNFLESTLIGSAISTTRMYNGSEFSGVTAIALTIELCEMNYGFIALSTFNQMNISKCLFKNQSGISNISFSDSAFINLEFNYGSIIGFISTGSEFMNLKIYYSTLNYTDNDWSGVDFRNTEILVTDLAEVDLTQGIQILASDYKTVYTRADGQVRLRYYSDADELVILGILE